MSEEAKSRNDRQPKRLCIFQVTLSNGERIAYTEKGVKWLVDEWRDVGPDTVIHIDSTCSMDGHAHWFKAKDAVHFQIQSIIRGQDGGAVNES